MAEQQKLSEEQRESGIVPGTTYVSFQDRRFKVNRFVGTNKIELFICFRPGKGPVYRTVKISDVETGVEGRYSTHATTGFNPKVGAPGRGRRPQHRLQLRAPVGSTARLAT